MSKKEENLINKMVSLYLDGGWEVRGRVKSVSDSKIVLEQDHTGELFLVFREKVSCLRLESASGPSSGVNRPQTPSEPPVLRGEAESFPSNDIGYNDSGMSIPRGMLENLPEEYDDDLSVSFGGTSDDNEINKKGQIEFRIDDDSKKED